MNLSLELLRLLSGDGERIVAVLEAFLDESGTHQGASVLTVAGYAGSHDQWKSFLSVWGNRRFHAKDLSSHRLKPLLWKAIRDCGVFGVSAWIAPHKYQASASAQLKSLLGNPYSFCAYLSALAICEFSRENEFGPVSFTLESGQPNVSRVRELLEFIQNNGDFNIASVGVASKDAFKQLYTADFLAHSRTSDPHWWDMLCRSGRVFDCTIPPSKLESASQRVAKDFSLTRFLRKTWGRDEALQKYIELTKERRTRKRNE